MLCGGWSLRCTNRKSSKNNKDGGGEKACHTHERTNAISVVVTIDTYAHILSFKKMKKKKKKKRRRALRIDLDEF